jgi:uncharacterized protein YndB with AHSA1/START domain
MKTALLIAAVFLGLLVVVGLVLYFIGRSLPEKHTSRLSVVLPVARPAVWSAITDYAKMPEWWPAVKAVRLEIRPNGEAWTWNRDAHGREMAFRTKEEQAPARLVREIMGENLPFGGTWTFELAEQGGQTRLTLTEDGFIRPPFFRVVAQLSMGLDTTMKDFVAHLEKHVAAK